MSHFDYQSSYRRNLPHIQPLGATVFVTFRLAGSLPQNVIEQWKKERQWLLHIAKTNPSHHERVKTDFERVWFAKFERILMVPGLARFGCVTNELRQSSTKVCIIGMERFTGLMPFL
jgi:hypothetical protein